VEVPAGVAAVVAMLRPEVTAAPLGVTGVGVKTQVAPAGKLTEAQVSATALLKLFVGFTVMV